MSAVNLYGPEGSFNPNLSEATQRRYEEFYRRAFEGLGVNSVHDCSIGSGGTTLPLAKLGYRVTGSDLSETLLARAVENFRSNGFDADFFISDFRELDGKIFPPVDMLISTSNSLPHVDTGGFRAFVRSARSVVREGGYLFFDIRNWDAVSAARPVFRAHNPHVMNENEHVATYLLFNWHDDGSVTFTFATSRDAGGRHESVKLSTVPRYYPLLRCDLATALEQGGFEVKSYFDMDEFNLIEDCTKTGDFEADFPNIGWYGVLARKC